MIVIIIIMWCFVVIYALSDIWFSYVFKYKFNVYVIYKLFLQSIELKLVQKCDLWLSHDKL